MSVPVTATHLQFTHELDAAWIIGLWKAIHGGDPAPEKIAAQAISALATVVAPPLGRTASFETFQKQFDNLGVTVKGPGPAHANAAHAKPRHRQYCFTFKGGATYCIEVQAPGGGEGE